MSIRTTISDLLARGSTGTDPSTALQDDGFGDVSAEEFGTALSHFSDTASLAEADALAPVVTRVGPVPLTESDILPIVTDANGEADAGAEAEDAFGLFGQAVEDLDLDLGEIDLDESDLSEPVYDSASDDDELEGTVESGREESAGDIDLHFGEPTPSVDPEEAPSGDVAGYDEFDSSTRFDETDTQHAIEVEQEPGEADLPGSANVPDADGLDDDLDDLDDLDVDG